MLLFKDLRCLSSLALTWRSWPCSGAPPAPSGSGSCPKITATAACSSAPFCSRPGPGIQRLSRLRLGSSVLSPGTTGCWCLLAPVRLLPCPCDRSDPVGWRWLALVRLWGGALWFILGLCRVAFGWWVRWGWVSVVLCLLDCRCLYLLFVSVVCECLYVGACLCTGLFVPNKRSLSASWSCNGIDEDYESRIEIKRGGHNWVQMRGMVPGVMATCICAWGDRGSRCCSLH